MWICLASHIYLLSSFFFFFNDTATTEIYTLSLHDALPICLLRCGRLRGQPGRRRRGAARGSAPRAAAGAAQGDRKSTRLNSSHSQISYAVFCLKKKKRSKPHTTNTSTAQYTTL